MFICANIISPKLTNDRAISIEQGGGSSANLRYSLEQNERKHYNAKSVLAFSGLRAEPGPPKYEAGKSLNQPRSLVGGGKKQVKGGGNMTTESDKLRKREIGYFIIL